MKPVYGHWIVEAHDGLYTTAYDAKLKEFKIDLAKHGKTLVCIKTVNGQRMMCEINDLRLVIKAVEECGDNYVREVFVAPKQ